MHNTPANNNKLLDYDPDGKPCQQKLHHCSVDGVLSYIQMMICPDTTMPI